MDFMVSLRYIFTFVDAALINRCHTGTSRSEGSHQVYQANPKDAAIHDSRDKHAELGGLSDSVGHDSWLRLKASVPFDVQNRQRVGNPKNFRQSCAEERHHPRGLTLEKRSWQSLSCSRDQNSSFSANCKTRGEPAEVIRPMLLPSVTFGLPRLTRFKTLKELGPKLELKLVALIGDPDRVLARGREALAARRVQVAAELADFVLANDGENTGAKRIKAQAFMELGERQINAIARNYYLSSAMYLLRDLPPQ